MTLEREVVTLIGYDFIRAPFKDQGPWEFFIMDTESKAKFPYQLDLTLSRLFVGEENRYSWHCSVKAFGQQMGVVRAGAIDKLGEELRYELNAISVSFLALAATMEKTFPAKESNIRKSVIAKIKESI